MKELLDNGEFFHDQNPQLTFLGLESAAAAIT
jgi:hypothetical protein